MDPFSLDDPLRMDHLALDMLEGDLMLADPAVEDSFRSDRLKWPLPLQLLAPFVLALHCGNAEMEICEDGQVGDYVGIQSQVWKFWRNEPRFLTVMN